MFLPDLKCKVMHSLYPANSTLKFLKMFLNYAPGRLQL